MPMPIEFWIKISTALMARNTTSFKPPLASMRASAARPMVVKNMSSSESFSAEVERQLEAGEAVAEREQDRHQAAADHRRGDAEAREHADVRHQRAADEQHDHRHQDRVDQVQLDRQTAALFFRVFLLALLLAPLPVLAIVYFRFPLPLALSAS